MKQILLKTMLLLCALVVGSSAWGTEPKTSTLTFTAACGGSGTADDNVSWTVTSDASESNYDSTKGIHYGTGSVAVSHLTLTTNGISGTITQIKVNAAGASGTSAKLNVKVGDQAFGSQQNLTSSATTYTLSGSASGSIEVKLSQSSIKKALYVKSIEVTYTPPSTSPLSSIALSGTYPTTFTEKDAFSHEGMTVTATYGDASTIDVTSSATFSGYDMNTTGNQTVTVSYTEGEITKTANYSITVNAGTKYMVTFDAGNGTCETESLTETTYQGGVTLPSATPGTSGWVFYGWAEEKVTNPTTTAPVVLSAGTELSLTSNKTLYAIYKQEETTIYTVTGSNLSGTTTATLLDSNHPITYKISSSNSYSNPLRLYSNGILTIAGGTMTQIVLTGENSTYPLTYLQLDSNSGSLKTLTASATWSDENGASQVKFKANGNQVRISSIEVTYQSTTISYASEPKPKAELSYATTEYNATYGTVFTKPTLTNTNNITPITYSSTETDVATVDENSGVITLVGAGTTVITASFAGNEEYAANAASYTLTVNKADQTLAFNPSTETYNIHFNDVFTEPSLVTSGAHTTISYSSSNPDVATVNETTGVIAIVGSGATVITATAAESNQYNSFSVAYTLNVRYSTIAEIKALTDASGSKSFSADLTDAVVTYVSGSHAYIQDETAAIYASCGTTLSAGQKINGAVNGTVKAAYKIDEITVLNLDDATVSNDGDIPAAQVKTLAEIKSAGTEYDGKLVTVNAATVKTGMNNATSGGVITDDGEITTFNIIAPNSLTLNATEVGNFTGFVSIYNGTTFRLNIYDATTQYQKTRNVATAQSLTFAEDAVELDEETSEYAAFTGQTVSGAQGAVSYAITGDAIYSDFNTSTGAVTLNGAYGTATITATAAAIEITTAGVTTPYTATTKSYTVTVYPRYTVTFNINGTPDVRRQATHGAEIEVPSPSAIGDYVFRGWSTTTVAVTDVAPSTTNVTNAPTADATYYAVFAIESGSPVEEHTSTFTIAQSSAPSSSPYVSYGSSWTWDNLTFTTTNNGACINKTNGSVTFTLPSGGKAKSLIITKTGNAWANDAAVVLKDASNNTLKTYTGSSLSFTFTSGSHDQSAYYTLTNSTGKNAWVDHITFVYTTGGITYSGYTTSISEVTTTVTSAGYSTYVTPFDIDFTQTEGMKAYAVQESQDEGFVDLVTVNAAPQGTPLILRNEGTFTLKKATTTPAVISTLLKVAETNVDVVGGLYVLSRELVGDKYVVGFYAIDADAIPQIPAGRVYLDLRGSNNVKAMMRFNFEEESTSIRLSTKDEGQNIIYDLQGRKVLNPVHGIYIVNGKKVFIK